MTTVATLSHFSARDPEKRRAYTNDRLGPAATYRLSEPLSYQVYDSKLDDYVSHTTRYVWLSTAQVCGEWETYAFPAYASGKVHSWSELPGSMKHCVDHTEVLEYMGLTVAHSVSKRLNGKRK